jgi:protein-L-isoaspartate(D-aspartate) O-methyltransferase
MAKFFLFFITLFFVWPAASDPAAEDPQIVQARKNMVERDLKGRDITDPRVLEVMGRVPRHLFVDKSLQNRAYSDHPLPIGEGQTISQPYIVALMTQLLNISPADRILEIGTGSGYQAAVLAELAARVYTVEIHEALAKKSAELLKRLGYGNVIVRHGDGYLGWEEHAPYNAVMVTCSIGEIPPRLIEQLKEGGRLVIPLGSPKGLQTLTLLTKRGGKTETRQIGTVSFVPMIDEKKKSRLP